VKTLLMITTAVLAAAPALAQSAPPAPPPGMDAPRGDRPMHMRGNRQMLFPNVSEDGRKILRETMRPDPADREALRAARDRINTLVAADRLDVAALKRAMEDERRLVDSQHAKRQATMIAAFQKLSAADRKAFAQDAQRGRQMMDARMARWRDAPPSQGE
jgi:uncharacterized membrane protein